MNINKTLNIETKTHYCVQSSIKSLGKSTVVLQTTQIYLENMQTKEHNVL